MQIPLLKTIKNHLHSPNKWKVIVLGVSLAFGNACSPDEVTKEVIQQVERKQQITSHQSEKYEEALVVMTNPVKMSESFEVVSDAISQLDFQQPLVLESLNFNLPVDEKVYVKRVTKQLETFDYFNNNFDESEEAVSLGYLIKNSGFSSVGIIHLESFVDLMDTQEFSSMEDIKSTLNTFKLEIESDEKLAEDEKTALLSAYHLIFFNLETIIQTVEDNTISTPVARCRFFCKTWRVLKSMYVGGAVGALVLLSQEQLWEQSQD